jgi:hypothetical protein
MDTLIFVINNDDYVFDKIENNKIHLKKKESHEVNDTIENTVSENKNDILQGGGLSFNTLSHNIFNSFQPQYSNTSDLTNKNNYTQNTLQSIFDF